MTTRDVSMEELRPRSRSERDFGLVVGVDHYPRFRSLQGAAADAIAFHAWMCDPDGGGVAPEHARLITSTPEPPTPLQDHVDEQVVELVQAADALGGARRLYVYFSGHGATCTDGAGDDVALLLAKWSTTLARLALSSHRYCRALGGLGLFEEIAMFLDCCRTASVGAVGMPPTFTCKATSEGSPARAFIAYATEAGRPSFERPQEGVWYGAFTRRLLAILTRSPQGIEAAALKETLERELREDAVQRAHVVNGLRGGSTFGWPNRGHAWELANLKVSGLRKDSTFGWRGVLPILEVRPDDEWEGFVELFDGTSQLVARHHPSAGTWTLPLGVGLYKLTYVVGARQSHEFLDHGRGGSTRLDFRPKLHESIVSAWSASTSDRQIPPRDRMQAFTLRRDEPMYIGSMPECVSSSEPERSCDARIRYDDGCYVIEDLGTGRATLFHGRIRDDRGTFSPDGERIRTKQLRDGDLFRCGELRLMVGHVVAATSRGEVVEHLIEVELEDDVTSTFARVLRRDRGDWDPAQVAKTPVIRRDWYPSWPVVTPEGPSRTGSLPRPQARSRVAAGDERSELSLDGDEDRATEDRAGGPHVTSGRPDLGPVAPVVSGPSCAGGDTPGGSQLSLRCSDDVFVTVYDWSGVVRTQGEGSFEALLPHGLYRIEAELLDHVTFHVIELDGDQSHQVGWRSQISTPAVEITSDLISYSRPAHNYSIASTTTPLGAAPQMSRLLVSMRRGYPTQTSSQLPSERVSIHDEDGRLLAELSPLTSDIFDGFGAAQGFVAFSCAVASGTYCLRASHSGRNVAITIPPGYAARVFVADVGSHEAGDGVVRLDDMRVLLVPTSANLFGHGKIARAMEGVIVALRSPGRRLSEYARALLRTSVAADLCFGIAAAHLLRRAEDDAGLEEVLHALAPYADMPDIAILRHVSEGRAADATPTLTTPPLLRASLQLAMTHPAFDLRGVPADSALSRAACRGYADSIWCTWSHDEDDEGWIAPTVAELRRDEADVVVLGRRLGIPPRRVQQALDELDAEPPDTSRE